MEHTVLIVDDESDVIDLVKYNLHRAGFQILTAFNGADGLRFARTEHPDVVVLDVMMPGMDGFEVCRALKETEETRGLPVIMLTAKAGASDRINGLEIGADDYLTKPFSPRELILRIQGLLRRSQAAAPSMTLQVDEFAINRATFEVQMTGRRLDLTTTEYKLLCLLIERRGKPQSRENLLHDVWGYENAIDTRTVDTHVRRLREKLGAASYRIETVRGMGYRYLSGASTN